MNLQERHSLPAIWLQSFAVTNRVFPRLLVIWLGFLLFNVLLYLAIKTFSLVFMQLIFTLASSTVFLFLFFFAVWMFNQLILCLFFAWGLRVIGNGAQDQNLDLFENAFSAAKPGFFLFIIGLLISLISLPVYFLTRHHPVIYALITLVLFFTVYLRLIYVYGLVALKDHGPIEGIVNSWKMTQFPQRYLDALLLAIMLVGTTVLYTLIAMLTVYGLYVIIPLFFAQSFTLASPSIGWWIVGIILALLAFFFLCQCWTFWMMASLNRYYQQEDLAAPAHSDNWIPLPNFAVAQDDLPDLNPVELPDRHVEEGLPPAVEKPVSQTPKPAEEKPVLEGLDIVSSSVNASEEDTKEIAQHLDQVYTPSKEQVVQKGDEDRMPTILFDDLMAQELDKKAQQFSEQEKNTKKKDQDPGSIQISK